MPTHGTTPPHVPPPSPEAHTKTSRHRRALPLRAAHPCPDPNHPLLTDIHSQQQLDVTILALQNAYFGAYNTCDLARFGALTDEHVEFYHDTGGITLGRDAFVQSIHDNICGKPTSETNRWITRLATIQEKEIESWQYLEARIDDARCRA